MSQKSKQHFWASCLWGITLLAMIFNLLFPVLDIMYQVRAQEGTEEPQPPVLETPEATEEPTQDVAPSPDGVTTTPDPAATVTPDTSAPPVIDPGDEVKDGGTNPPSIPAVTQLNETFGADVSTLATNGWELSAGWLIQVEDAAGTPNYYLSAQPTTIVENASLPAIVWTDVALSARVRLNSGDTASIGIRVSAADEYRIVIDSNGVAQLFRSGVLVTAGPVPAEATQAVDSVPVAAAWRTVAVQVNGSTITVAVEGVAQFTYTDTMPLGAGTIVFSSGAANSRPADFDDIAVTLLNLPVSAPPTTEPTIEGTVEATAPAPESTEEVVSDTRVLLSADFEGELVGWTLSADTGAGVVPAGNETNPDNHALLMASGTTLTPTDSLMIADFQIDARVNVVSADSGGLSITLRDSYKLTFDTTGAVLYRGDSEIARSETLHEANTWYSITISVQASRFILTVNGVSEIDFVDTDAVPAGSIGFAAVGAAMIDDVVVTDLTDASLLAANIATPTPLSLTPETQAKFDPSLLNVLTLWVQGDHEAAAERAAAYGMQLDAEGRTRVVIVAAEGLSGESIRPLVEGTGGLVETIFDRNITAVVPLESLLALVNTTEVALLLLPDVASSADSLLSDAQAVVQAVGTITPQSLDIISANDWNNLANIRGANIDIAVIDSAASGGFAGATPGSGAGGGNQQCLYNAAGGPAAHGTAVVEVICDVAPNSRVLGFLANNSSDIVTVIDSIRNNTSVAGIAGNVFEIILITMDLGVHTSSGDGTDVGIAARSVYDAVSDARNVNNILVIASAGNNAGRYISFNYTGGGATIPLVVGNGGRVNISWSGWSNTAIDISASLSGPGAKPARAGGLPGYQFNPGCGSGSCVHSLTLSGLSGAGSVVVQVQVTGGDAALIGSPSGVTALTTTGNIARPADSPNVFAVGAVCANQSSRYPRLSDSSFGPIFAAGGTGPGTLASVGDYKPEVVAPSHVSVSQATADDCVINGRTATPTSGFNGTSAAAAHVAGMAALLRSNTANISMGANFGPGVAGAPVNLERYLLGHTIDVYDAAPDGVDVFYGAGLVSLGATNFDVNTISNYGDVSSHDLNTVYVGQADLTSAQTGTSISPYWTIAHAIALNPNKRIIVMPGEYMAGFEIPQPIQLVSYDAADLVDRFDTWIWVTDAFAGASAVGGIAISNVDNVTVEGFFFNGAHPLSLPGPNSALVRPAAIQAFGTANLNILGNSFAGFIAPINLNVDGLVNVLRNNFSNFVIPTQTIGLQPPTPIFDWATLFVRGTLGSEVINVQFNTFSNNIIAGKSSDDNLPQQAIVRLEFGAINFYSNRLYNNASEAVISISQWNDEFSGTRATLASEVRIFSNNFNNNTLNGQYQSVVNFYQAPRFRFINNTVTNHNLSIGTRVELLSLGGSNSPISQFDGSIGVTPVGAHRWEIGNNLFYNNTFNAPAAIVDPNRRNLIEFINGGNSLPSGLQCANLAGTENAAVRFNWFIYLDTGDLANQPTNGECLPVATGTPSLSVNSNAYSPQVSTTAMASFEAAQFFGTAIDPIDPYRLRPASLGLDSGEDAALTVFGTIEPPETTNVFDALNLPRVFAQDLIYGPNDVDRGAYELSPAIPPSVTGEQVVAANEDQPFIAFQLGSAVVGGIRPYRFQILSSPSNYNTDANSLCGGQPLVYSTAENQVVYCPPPNFFTLAPNAVVTFDYLVTDILNSGTAQGTVRININPTNDGAPGTTGAYGTQRIFTDVSAGINYRMRPYVDFNNFNLSDPTLARDYNFTFSFDSIDGGAAGHNADLFNDGAQTTTQAITGALNNMGANNGNFILSPVPGEYGSVEFLFDLTDRDGQTVDKAGRVRITVVARLAGIGLHDDVSLDYLYDTSWAPLYYENATNNTLHYTATANGQFDFPFAGDTFIVNMIGYPGGGTFRVELDPDGIGVGAGYSVLNTVNRTALGLTCSTNILADGTVSNALATVSFYNLGCRGLDANPTYGSQTHTLRLVNLVTGSSIHIDSIEIRGPTLSPGYYENSDFALSYSAGWQESPFAGLARGGTIHVGDLTSETVTFQFDSSRSDGFIIYYVQATIVGDMRVCNGATCVDIPGLASTTVWNRRAWINKGQLGISGTGVVNITIRPRVDGGLIALDGIFIRGSNNNLATLTTTGGNGSGLYEENTSLFRYIGLWSDGASATAVGGSSRTTTDLGASILFNIDANARGVQIYRTISASHGTMEVCISNTCQIITSTSAETLFARPVTIRVTTPGPHLVEIRNTSALYTTIEAIQVLGVPTAYQPGFYENNNPNITYGTGWAEALFSVGPSGGSIHGASATSAVATLTIDAAAVQRIVIYRTLYSLYGLLQVCNGAVCVDVTGFTPPDALGNPLVQWIVPSQVIPTASLGIGSSGTATITIRPKVNGQPIGFDAIEMLGAAAPLGVGFYQNTNADISYSGFTRIDLQPGPLGGSFHRGDLTSHAATFQITNAVGRILIYRILFSSYGDMQVCNGATCVDVSGFSPDVLYGQPSQVIETTGTGTNRLNCTAFPCTITLKPKVNGVPVGLDAVQLLAPATVFGVGFHQDSNTNFNYNGWTNFPLAVGPLGGSFRTASQTTQTATFQISNAVLRMVIYRVQYSLYGDMQVCNGATCVDVTGFTPPDALGNALVIWGQPAQVIETTGTGANRLNCTSFPCTITLRPKVTGLPVGFDAMELLGARTALNPGFYQESNSNIDYNGWTTTTVTPGPLGGSYRSAALTTQTATFDVSASVTRIIVYRAMLNSLGDMQVCNGATCVVVTGNNGGDLMWGVPSQVIPTTGAGGLGCAGVCTITIKPAVSGLPVVLDAIELYGTASALAPGFYQDLNPNINVDSWTRGNAVGPLGGTYHSAATTSQTATFQIANGVSRMIIYRVLYSAFGDMQVCNGATCVDVTGFTPPDALGNATVVWGAPSQIIETTGTGANRLNCTSFPCTITLRPKVNGVGVALDAVELFGPQSALTPGLYQDTNPNITYTGTWTQILSPTYNGGSIRYSATSTNTLSFQISGNATGFVLVGMRINPGATVQFCATRLSNTQQSLALPGNDPTTTCPTISMAAPPDLIQTGYGFAFYGLPADVVGASTASETYTVTITNQGPTGSFLVVDAIIVLGEANTTMTAGFYDDRAAQIVYSPSYWRQTNNALLLNGTYSTTANAGAVAQMEIQGNSVTIFQPAVEFASSNVNFCLVIRAQDSNIVQCSNFSQLTAATALVTPITIYGFGFGTHDIVLEHRGHGQNFFFDGLEVR